MANVNANINVNIQTQQAAAQLRKLSADISRFNQQSFAANSAAAQQQRALNQALIDGVKTSGQFRTAIVPMTSAVENFSNSIEKGKLSLGQYTRYAASQLPGMRRAFTREFDMINRVAESRVRKLNTQFIALGESANGMRTALAMTPTALDQFAARSAIALQRQQIFNRLLRDGSTQLLNWGKNTQWAGRQLMVGFTIPLGLLGAQAAKVFRELEAEAINFKKVYGDMFTTDVEVEKNLAAIKELSMEMTKYGQTAQQTMQLANTAAQSGARGAELMAATTQATRLAILGQMEQNQAIETTISLQTAFTLSNEELAESINFLNSVENQTILSLQDVSEAIPRVASVIKGFGGDVQDLSVLLVAMKEGGVSAAEGANALKNSMARVIAPTKRALETSAKYGIALQDIVARNEGKVIPLFQELAKALEAVGGQERQEILSDIFGKFQYARIGTLLSNIARDGSQAAKAIELTGVEARDLAATAERELSAVEDAVGTKFTAALEKAKIALAPVGEEFLKALTPVLDTVGKILDKFNDLPGGLKTAIVAATAIIGGIAPIVLMVTGLVANGIANIAKFILFLRKQVGILRGNGEQFKFYSGAELEAAAAAASLEGKTSSLTRTMLLQRPAIETLITLYQRLAASAAAAAAAMPATMGGVGIGRMPAGLPRGGLPRLPQARNTGGPIFMADGKRVPGSGNTDKVPAMLTPGEYVVNKQATKESLPLLEAINSGNIVGRNKGGIIPQSQYLNRGAMVLSRAQQLKKIKEVDVLSRSVEDRSLASIFGLRFNDIKADNPSSFVKGMFQRWEKMPTRISPKENTAMLMKGRKPRYAQLTQEEYLADMIMSGNKFANTVDAFKPITIGAMPGRKGDVRVFDGHTRIHAQTVKGLIEKTLGKNTSSMSREELIASIKTIRQKALNDELSDSVILKSVSNERILAQKANKFETEKLFAGPGKETPMQSMRNVRGRTLISGVHNKEIDQIVTAAKNANFYGVKKNSQSLMESMGFVSLNNGAYYRYEPQTVMRNQSSYVKNQSRRILDSLVDQKAILPVRRNKGGIIPGVQYLNRAGMVSTLERFLAQRKSSIPATGQETIFAVNRQNKNFFAGLTSKDDDNFVYHGGFLEEGLSGKTPKTARNVLDNLFGPGLYTSRNPERAATYTAHNKKPLTKEEAAALPINMVAKHDRLLYKTPVTREMERAKFLDLDQRWDSTNNPVLKSVEEKFLRNVKERTGIDLSGELSKMLKGRSKIEDLGVLSKIDSHSVGAIRNRMVKTALRKMVPQKDIKRAEKEYDKLDKKFRKEYTDKEGRSLPNKPGFQERLDELKAAGKSFREMDLNPAYIIEEAWSDAIKSAGLYGMRHQGGLRAGKGEILHDVLIWNRNPDTIAYANKGGMIPEMAPVMGTSLVKEWAQRKSMTLMNQVASQTQRLKANRGRIVPGTGNTDTVPAMLTPGEFVVNKEATRQNLPLIKAINDGQPVSYLNKGDQVGGKRQSGTYSSRGRLSSQTGRMTWDTLDSEVREAKKAMKGWNLTEKQVKNALQKSASHIVQGEGRVKNWVSKNLTPDLQAVNQYMNRVPKVAAGILKETETIEKIAKKTGLSTARVTQELNNFQKGIHPITQKSASVMRQVALIDERMSKTAISTGKKTMAYGLPAQGGYQASAVRAILREREKAAPGRGFYQTRGERRYNIPAGGFSTVRGGGTPIPTTKPSVAAPAARQAPSPQRQSAAQQLAREIRKNNPRLTSAQSLNLSRLQLGREQKQAIAGLQSMGNRGGGGRTPTFLGMPGMPEQPRQSMYSRMSSGVGRFGMGAGMALSMGSMLPMMNQDEQGKFMGMDAGTAMMGMMGGGMLLSIAPMLGSAALPVIALGAVAAGVGLALKSWRNNVDETSRRTADLGANLGVTANSVNVMAKLLGERTPVERRTQLQLGVTADEEQFFGEFQNYLGSEQGAKFLDELRNSTFPERVRKMTDYLKNAIATEMFTQEQASAFAKAVSLSLGDAIAGSAVISNIRGQETGTKGMLDILRTRAAAEPSDAIERAQTQDRVSIEDAGTIVGFSTQMFQDAANVQALAFEELAAGEITQAEYMSIIDETRSLQEKYNIALQNVITKTNDLGGTMQAVLDQLKDAGLISDEQQVAVTKAQEGLLQAAKQTPGALRAESDKATLQNATNAEEMLRYQIEIGNQIPVMSDTTGELTTLDQLDPSQYSDFRITDQLLLSSIDPIIQSMSGNANVQQLLDLPATLGSDIESSLSNSKTLESAASNLGQAILDNPGATQSYIDLANKIAEDTQLQEQYATYLDMPGGGGAGAFDAMLFEREISEGRAGLGEGKFVRDMAIQQQRALAGQGIKASDYQSYLYNFEEGEQRQAAVRAMQGATPEAMSATVMAGINMRDSVGQAATQKVLSSAEMTSAIQEGDIEKINNLKKAVQEAGQVFSDEEFDAVVSVAIEESVNGSAEDIETRIPKLTEGAESIKENIPPEMVATMGIDLSLPEDIEKFGPIAEQLGKQWPTLQSLNPNINMEAAIDFLTMDGSEALSPEETAKRVATLNKAWKNLSSSDPEVKKQAMIDLAIAYAGQGVEGVEGGSPAEMAASALSSLRSQFEQFDQLDPIVANQMILIQTNLQVANAQDLAKIAELQADAEDAARSADWRTYAIKMNEIAGLEKGIADRTEQAQAQLTAVESTGTVKGGNNGGGGGGKESPLKGFVQNILNQVKLWTDATAKVGDLNNAKNSFTQQVLKGQGIFDKLKNLKGMSPTMLEQILAMGPEGAMSFVKKYGQKGSLTKAGRNLLNSESAARINQTVGMNILGAEQKRMQSMAATRLRSRGESDELIQAIAGDPQKAADYLKLQRAANKGIKGAKKDLKEYLRAQQDIVDATREEERSRRSIEEITQERFDVISLDFDVQEFETRKRFEEEFAQANNKTVMQMQKSVDKLDEEIRAQEKIIDLKQDEIDKLNRANELDQRRIDSHNEQIDKQQDLIDGKERQNELDQREIDKLSRQDEIRQRTADALQRELDLMSETEDEIRQTYDKRIKALDQVSKLNTHIINQQRQQIDLSRALSEGDVYAAAQAAEQMRQSSAEFAIDQTRVGLEQSMENEIGSLRTSQGLTREQAEQQIKNIKDQSYQTSLLIRDIEDGIYERNLEMIPLQDEIYRIKSKLIKPIEDQIAQRNLEIRNYNDEIHNISTGIVAEKTKERDAQVEILDNYERKLGYAIADLTVAGKTREEWESIQTATDLYLAKKEKLDEFETTWANIVASMAEAARLAPQIGAPSISLPGGKKNYAGGLIKYAGGGFVPGTGGMDSISSMLMPGEFVIRKAMVDKYGIPMLENINQGSFSVPRYNLGTELGQPVVANSTSVSNINAPVYNTYDMRFNISGANASADEIAHKVMTKIRNVDSASIRRINGY